MTRASGLRGVERFGLASLAVGVAGFAACAAGAVLSPQQFFRSYLVAYLFWAGIALGCLAIVLLHHLAGGDWGAGIRPILDGATRTIPLLVLLFVPIVLGLRHLYVWARPEEVATEPLLQRKSVYLNAPFFLTRTAVYFAIWLAIAYIFSRRGRPDEPDSDLARSDLSGKRPEGRESVSGRRLRLLSGPGLVLYGLTATFASVDWVMSLEPHWYSTVYGLLFIVGQVLAGLAFVIPVSVALSRAGVARDSVTPDRLNDLGNLLLAFVMIWSYLAFSQYLIIWSANLPEEIPWYLHRVHGGWQWIALSLVVLHFAIPFVLLLSRATKRNASILSKVAIAIVVMRFVDLFWVVSPAFDPSGIRIHWMDLAAPAAVGGIWAAVFAWQLRRGSAPVYPPDVAAPGSVGSV